MKTLLLMRHGEAPQAKTDRDRMLSEYGKQQCLGISQQLNDAKLSNVISTVITSDYQRAIDSAKLVCPINKEVITESRTELLRPMSEPKQAFSFILEVFESISEQGALLVVCHLPIIAELAGLALDGFVSDKHHFPCASVMCLQTELPEQGCFDLAWQKLP
jgi:phosphohistidine phosphatase SixA